MLSAVRTGRLYPRAIVRSEGFYANEKSTVTSWDRTSNLLICSKAPETLYYRGSPTDVNSGYNSRQ
jgi:hypothetical protein